MILNVAEKPSVAKSIANILSSDISHEHTHSIYNKVYKFQYNLMSITWSLFYLDEDVEMLFTSVTGHLN